MKYRITIAYVSLLCNQYNYQTINLTNSYFSETKSNIKKCNSDTFVLEYCSLKLLILYICMHATPEERPDFTDSGICFWTFASEYQKNDNLIKRKQKTNFLVSPVTHAEDVKHKLKLCYRHMLTQRMKCNLLSRRVEVKMC